MHIKLDENLGLRGADIFRAAGHEVSSVFEQGLTSAPDEDVADVCRREGRCLVTLDLDFANPLRYNPRLYTGIAVIRMPPKATPKILYDIVHRLAGAMSNTNITGKLWIAQQTGIREYQPEN